MVVLDVVGSWPDQVPLAFWTVVTLGVLITVVSIGLLGNPDMFIAGNGSSQTYLEWYEARAGEILPQPVCVSVSIWFYRLLMLAWALWLAFALLGWLKWAWEKFILGGIFKSDGIKNPAVTPPTPPSILPQV